MTSFKSDTDTVTIGLASEAEWKSGREAYGSCLESSRVTRVTPEVRILSLPLPPRDIPMGRSGKRQNTRFSSGNLS